MLAIGAQTAEPNWLNLFKRVTWLKKFSKLEISFFKFLKFHGSTPGTSASTKFMIYDFGMYDSQGYPAKLCLINNEE